MSWGRYNNKTIDIKTAANGYIVTDIQIHGKEEYVFARFVDAVNFIYCRMHATVPIGFKLINDNGCISREV